MIDKEAEMQNKNKNQYERNLDNLLNDMSLLSHDPDPYGLITSVIEEERPKANVSPRDKCKLDYEKEK